MLDQQLDSNFGIFNKKIEFYLTKDLIIILLNSWTDKKTDRDIDRQEFNVTKTGMQLL